MLESVHPQRLQLALGAFRAFPVESLYMEAGEPSSYVHMENLVLQYVIRLAPKQIQSYIESNFPTRYFGRNCTSL